MHAAKLDHVISQLEQVGAVALPYGPHLQQSNYALEQCSQPFTSDSLSAMPSRTQVSRSMPTTWQLSFTQGACDEWGRGQARSVAVISASTPWQAGPLPLHREWACLEEGSQGQGGGQPVGLVREALCLCAGQYAVPQA